MATPTHRDAGDPLDELVAEALARLDEEGDEGLARFLAEHSADADAVRGRIDSLRAAGFLEASTAGAPGRLGEFRLLEPLGAGGMGVVYRAVQEPLGREVALKVIRPEQLFFREARARFRREVETVASLQHPGIVAVHAVGEENGVPYFAMELVRGRSLEDLLGGLKDRDPATLRGRDLDPAGEGRGYLFEGTWEEACLRVVRQVAEALEFAHANGVLHRDIKPSNVMIATEGAPRALLLDFGLATGNRDAALTRTGVPVGSLRYMASEQLRGDSARVGPRTDVYGLGLTLYELLAVGPAYSARSEADLIVAIEHGDLPRLTARNPHVSWEAQTICETATDRDPERRYASVADLARDLANALERRPIEARRATALLRARRWVQRRPGAAAAAALSVVLAVGGPAAYAWQQRRASRAMAVQLERAERLADLSLESMDRLLARLGSEDLRLVPQVEPVRRAALEDAVELAERLVAERGDDPRARQGAASAYARLGRLLAELGRHGEAAGAYVVGVERLSELAAERGTAPGADAGVGRLRTEYARALVGAGELEEARAELEALDRDLGEAIGADAPPDLVQVRAAARTTRGALLKDLDDLPAARELLTANTAELDELCAAHPDDVSLVSEAAMAWGELALMLGTRFSGWESLDPDTLPAMRRAVDMAQRLAELEPEEVRHRLGLAVARSNLGGAYRRSGELDEAEACFVDARALLEPLVRDFPATLLYKQELATAAHHMAVLAEARADEAEGAEGRALMERAIEHYRRTIELLDELAVAAPQEFVYVHRVAIARYNLAALLHATDAVEPWSEQARRAVRAAERAAKLAPDSPDVLRTLFDAHWMMVGVHLAHDDHERAAAEAEHMPAAIPDTWQPYSRAAVAYGRCADLVRREEGLDDAERERLVEAYGARGTELLRRSIELGVPEPERIGEVGDLAGLRGTAAFAELVDEVTAE